MDKTKDMAVKEKLCKEKDAIADKLMSGQEMSIQDLEKLDKIYHTLKNLCKYLEMSGEYEYEDGVSGARGRGPDGRYISRMGTYDDGYARGYSEAMSRMDGNSGTHYPAHIRNGW